MFKHRIHLKLIRMFSKEITKLELGRWIRVIVGGGSKGNNTNWIKIDFESRGCQLGVTTANLIRVNNEKHKTYFARFYETG